MPKANDRIGPYNSSASSAEVRGSKESEFERTTELHNKIKYLRERELKIALLPEQELWQRSMFTTATLAA